MKKTICCILLAVLHTAYGQSPYRFSKDIVQQIEKDTTAWKYQVGATELSFSGHYNQVLLHWDKNGVRKPTVTAADQLYFERCQQQNAQPYIIEQAKHAEVTIINEAHHLSSHRSFTRSLLRDLYANGYRYLGLEALFDSEINKRKFATQDSGYYTQEPEFGNLIHEALELGFTLFSYEASQGKNGKEREIEQAQNIVNFIQNNPNGKVLIHCGYAHAYENDYPAWEKAMAGRLKEFLQLDPLTIDQTYFMEKSDTAYMQPYLQLYTGTDPVVLIGEDGKVFNGVGNNQQTDIVVLHPKTKYIDQRPHWLIAGKQKYSLPHTSLFKHFPRLVLAYRINEKDQGGIPADVIELTDENSPRTLYLNKGSYQIVVLDEQYETVGELRVELN